MNTPSKQLLLTCADLYINEPPRAVEILDVPAYYKDKEGYRKAIETMELDGRNAITFAFTYIETGDIKYYNACTRILNAWASINKGVGKKGDSALTFATRGQNLIEAAAVLNEKVKDSYLDYNDVVFYNWVNSVYIPVLQKFKKSWIHRWNNHKSWALTGLVLAEHYNCLYQYNNGTKKVNTDKLKVLYNEVYKHFKFCSKEIKFLSKPGELWIENLRTNAGMYYTYFNIAATLKSLIYLNKVFPAKDYTFISPQLYTLYNYCKHPETWNYKPTKIPLLKQLQKLIFPYPDTVRILTPDEKGGQLYQIAGAFFGSIPYKEYGVVPLNVGDAFWHSSYRMEMMKPFDYIKIN